MEHMWDRIATLQLMIKVPNSLTQILFLYFLLAQGFKPPTFGAHPTEPCILPNLNFFNQNQMTKSLNKIYVLIMTKFIQPKTQRVNTQSTQVQEKRKR
jgi:hypothetical protein